MSNIEDLGREYQDIITAQQWAIVAAAQGSRR